MVFQGGLETMKLAVRKRDRLMKFSTSKRKLLLFSPGCVAPYFLS